MWVRARTIRLAAAAAVAVAALVATVPSAAADTDPAHVVVGTGDDSRSIERLYRAYFLRDPDPAGLAHWEQQRARGMPLESISAAFARSDEFRTRYGALSDGDFVTLVYRNVLDREPDPGGHRHWTAQLDRGTSRGQVMLGFSDSEEFKRRTLVIGTGDDSRSVERLYRAYFLRPPDDTGLAYWNHERSRGVPLGAISDAFAASDEFRNRYGALSDADFVDLVYRNVLDRAPDPGGFDHWTAALRRGVSRGQVMLGFSDSEEFKRTALAPRGSPPPPDPDAEPVYDPDPAKPTAPEGTYAFANVADGLPVQWAPCDAVSVVANFAGAPAGADDVLGDVLDQLSAATRIPWVLEGETAERSTGADYDRPLRDVARYGDRFSPVLVSWPEPGLGPNNGALLRRVAFELEGGTPRYVTGSLDMNRDRPASELTVALLYGFGYLAGLADVGVGSQVMGTGGFGPGYDTYQEGDVAGLARVGAWDWNCP